MPVFPYERVLSDAWAFPRIEQILEATNRQRRAHKYHSIRLTNRQRRVQKYHSIRLQSDGIITPRTQEIILK